MERHLVLSVHQLVDFLLRKGDIDERVYNRSTMNEGTKIHAYYQKKQGNDYLSEYFLKNDIIYEGVRVTLSGRADGVIFQHGYYIIDEIKSTIIDLEQFFSSQFEWHIGQAKCYAYLLAKEKNLTSIGVRLTYIRQNALENEKDKMIKEYSFTFIELEHFVYGLIDAYLSFYNLIFTHEEKRIKSSKELTFPFSSFRLGQKELIELVSEAAFKNKTIFVEAPTGIGKTISTLFPFIKASSDDEMSKIFYLTAKNVGKINVFDTVRILKENGLFLYLINITAKEKICFCKGKQCNPDECPFTKDYYSKVQIAIKYALTDSSSFDYFKIVEIAKEFEICPFEFQLDLSLFMDLIVCDYNYMFDPISYLKRFFDEDQSHFLTLIDEAHNLVERSKDMYSALLEQDKVNTARASIRKIKNRKLKNLIKKIDKIFDYYFDNYILDKEHDEYIMIDELKNEFKLYLDDFIQNYTKISKENNKDITSELKDLFLQINRFSKIYELKNENFLLYLKVDNNLLEIHLSCIDASDFINNISKRNRANVFFSATLSPKEYYVNALMYNEEDKQFTSFLSPFDKNNFRVLVNSDISIKYKNRNQTIQSVVEYIKAFISSKVGNYFIYCPSYEYLSNLVQNLKDEENVELHVQNKDMNEEEKRQFLSFFMPNPNKTNIGLLVLGSIFSEGIDLIDDRLIGVVIIGVGLPRINFLSDEIKKHYDEKGLNGYSYAYLYPGLNKVMQAVGRVIRSESDIGSALFIDERYNTYPYRQFLKEHYPNLTYVHSPIEVKKITHYFFYKKKNMV